MSVREKGGRFYISFKCKGERINDTAIPSARNEAEAKRIDKSLKTAFKIFHFDHLKPPELEVALRIFENKGWKLPPELRTPEPEEELTLMKGIKDYLDADETHRAERNLFAIDRLIERFGESYPLAELKVPQIKAYRNYRLQKVQGATVNREMSVLSGIFWLFA